MKAHHFLRSVLFFLVVFAGVAAHAVTISATKDCSLPPCTVTESGTFAAAGPTFITWQANYNPSAPTEGNDFWLTTNASSGVTAPPDGLVLTSSLSSGFNTGTTTVPAGTYRIAIRSFLMGGGSYSVTANPVVSITRSPASHDFGSHVSGSGVTASFSFSISAPASNDLPVTLAVGAPSNAHFEITTNPSGTTLNPGSSATLAVRFNPMTIPGPPPQTFNGTISISGTSVPAGASVTPVSVALSGTTTPNIPNIACSGASCGTAASLGSVDGSVGAVGDFTYIFQNTGTAVLHITGPITLVNDSIPAVFSFTSPPSTADVGAMGSRSVQIHFAPPAPEATYCGHIVIPSNDPDTPSKSCFFSAVSHHPVPRMVVAATTLDYHDVELGFSFNKPLIVSNTGDAPLIFSVTDSICTSDPMCAPNLPQWTVGPFGPFTINPGAGPQIIDEIYHPSALAAHTIRLRVSGNDLMNPTVDVTLTGRGISPVPIDSVLVMDRSGSMADPAGPRRKIDALRSAADLFVHLLRPDSGSGTGDKVGLVRYNNLNDVYLPLDFVNAAHITDAENHLSDAAVHDVARLGPQGSTGIGGGMQTGAGALLPPNATRKHVLIVLTDGKENELPNIADVRDPIIAADSDIKMYSIGVGSDVEPPKLASIPNVANGYFQAPDDLSGVSRFDLETFYFKIFSNATGMSLIVDPTQAVFVSGLAPITIGSAQIVSSDHHATFLVLDDPLMRPFYDLAFIDPAGHVIDVGSSIGGTPVHVLHRLNYSLYRVVFPDPSMASVYVGQWTLILKPNGKWRELIKQYERQFGQVKWDFINPFSGLVPIAFAAAVGSDYQMHVTAASSSGQPGSEIALTAWFTDRGAPSTGKEVKVDVEEPGGTQTLGMPLYDDGTHGDVVAGDGTWSGRFLHTPDEGAYRILFRGIGKNFRGELAPREETRFVVLAKPHPPGDQRCPNCVPCDPRKTRNCVCFTCKPR